MGLFATLANLTRRAEPAPRQRSMEAATGGRRAGGMGQSFGLRHETPSAAIIARRARHARLNNAWLSNAVTNLTTALAGSGIRPAPIHETRQVRRAAARAFDRWAVRADYHGRTDFWGLQRLVAEHLVVDGEALVLMRHTATGLQLQVLPPEHLDRNKSDGHRVIDGIEHDAEGRRVAYWLSPQRQTATWQTYAPSVRVEAEHVLHIVHALDAGQVRGMSWLAPALLAANDLDQLEDALRVSAKIAAMHAGFIKNLSDPSGIDTVDAADLSLEPGAIRILPGGADVTFNSPGQLQESGAFLRHNLQSLAAALGVPEHLLSGDMSNANYSSLRAGLLPFRARIEAVQYGTLVPQFLAPVWAAWLEDQPDLPADLGCDWIPPKPLQVDPLKDVNATAKLLELGLTTKARAIAELGWNPDDLEGEGENE